jgi:hypothetical protein
MTDDVLSYNQTLDALVGWIDGMVRATASDSSGNPILVLNGQLGRAPDSSEGSDEALFFCVGHNNPRDGADGFFVPSATFRHGMYLDAPVTGEPESELFIAFNGGGSLVVACIEAPSTDG